MMSVSWTQESEGCDSNLYCCILLLGMRVLNFPFKGKTTWSNVGNGPKQSMLMVQEQSYSKAGMGHCGIFREAFTRSSQVLLSVEEARCCQKGTGNHDPHSYHCIFPTAYNLYCWRSQPGAELWKVSCCKSDCWGLEEKISSSLSPNLSCCGAHRGSCVL